MRGMPFTQTHDNKEKTHSVARVGSNQTKSNWLNQWEIRMCDGYQLSMLLSLFQQQYFGSQSTCYR
jgi:hypothetical protein